MPPRPTGATSLLVLLVCLAEAACQALPAAPPDVGHHLRVSAERGRAGDPDAAMEAVERALALEPGHVEARLRKAELLVERGYAVGDPALLGEAATLVAAVFDEQPNRPEAWFVLGKIALAKGDPQACAIAMKRALEARPGWAPAYYVLGHALARLGEFESARAHVAAALAAEPGLVEPRRMLAQLHLLLGAYEDAIEQGRIYLASQPDSTEIHKVVAESLGRLGRYDAAFAELEAIPPGERDADVAFMLGMLHHLSGEPERARERMLEAWRVRPNDPKVLEALLAVDRSLGRLDDSAGRIAAARAAQPDDVQLLRVEGALALAQGDVARAEKALEAAVQRAPQHLATHRHLSRLYLATGRIDQAIATYRRALAERPGSAQAHQLLGILYEARGDVELARREYESALAIQDDLPIARNNLAYLLATEGEDLDRALELAQLARKQRPGDPGVADTLGWVLLRRGAVRAAVVYLQQAEAGMQAAAHERGDTRLHLAQAYAAQGRPDLALQTLDVAIREIEQQLATLREGGGDPPEPDWTRRARALQSQLRAEPPAVATGPPDDAG